MLLLSSSFHPSLNCNILMFHVFVSAEGLVRLSFQATGDGDHLCLESDQHFDGLAQKDTARKW